MGATVGNDSDTLESIGSQYEVGGTSQAPVSRWVLGSAVGDEVILGVDSLNTVGSAEVVVALAYLANLSGGRCVVRGAEIISRWNNGSTYSRLEVEPIVALAASGGSAVVSAVLKGLSGEQNALGGIVDIPARTTGSTSVGALVIDCTTCRAFSLACILGHCSCNVVIDIVGPLS